MGGKGNRKGTETNTETGTRVEDVATIVSVAICHVVGRTPDGDMLRDIIRLRVLTERIRVHAGTATFLVKVNPIEMMTRKSGMPRR